ncbi:YIP1 family protein [Alicyclobacillus sp. SO9]|uniref:YIP1 family protein n=1 Tax=Alicyclobacillus sp. SO9 TaxID=2665646 RepID=UPI0018E7E6F9|nr:YIP1 family protein [Alicyclobacillus sp. SO9]QQE80265.1 YIP1 family protein [Alicyclobacillus sp. SO9]
MDTSPQQPIEDQAKSSWFSLISSPSEFFRTRRTRVPWVLPLIIVSVVTGIMAIAELPTLMHSAVFQQTLQQASAKAPGAAALVKSITEGGLVIAGFIGPWISVLLGGLILWVLTKLFGMNLSYRNTLGILSNAHIIAALEAVVTGIVIVSTGTMTKGFLSLNMLVQASPTSHTGALLSALSIFWLWMLYITIAGVAEVTGSSKGKASGPVLIVTILGLILIYLRVK